MTTAEIRLNEYLEQNGVTAFETDLAELILQLGHDQPSHIIAPALHKNRQQVRELFARTMNLPELTDDPETLTAAARAYLRERFLRVKTAICGANFLAADTGAIAIVESEGNGRMCLTLPDTLIAIAGIEKVIPRFNDLEVLLQTLSRSATGERMNPYNSIWRGVVPGDGPQQMHLVLLDNGRSRVLRDSIGRQTLKCIRCAACQNACPVYRQTGGHAYGSVYAGPIGAILTPQLMDMRHAQSLPFASSLCGACYEVCPVKINIPEVLVHLRSRVVDRGRRKLASLVDSERGAMKMMAAIFANAQRLERAQWLARTAQRVVHPGNAWYHWLPGMAGRWTETRDLAPLPAQTFREWWQQREQR
jgi:L-lactate dehydrogenase complex protein LldF